jgi:hypothetical protein
VKFYDAKGRGSSEREPSIIWQGYNGICSRIQLLNKDRSPCIRFSSKANYRRYTKCRKLGSDHDGKLSFMMLLKHVILEQKKLVIRHYRRKHRFINKFLKSSLWIIRRNEENNTHKLYKYKFIHIDR